MNNNIMRLLGLAAQVQMVEDGLCPLCEKPVVRGDFASELSLREYAISGLCQSCQNNFFE
jgi:hypothetical protein